MTAKKQPVKKINPAKKRHSDYEILESIRYNDSFNEFLGNLTLASNRKLIITITKASPRWSDVEMEIKATNQSIQKSFNGIKPYSEQELRNAATQPNK